MATVAMVATVVKEALAPSNLALVLQTIAAATSATVVAMAATVATAVKAETAVAVKLPVLAAMAVAKEMEAYIALLLKIALAKGSAMVKTAQCSGEGGILVEEKKNAYKYIFEYVPNKYSVNDENLKSSISEKLSKKITDICYAVIYKTIGMNTDVFNLGRSLKNANPEKFKKLEKTWSQNISECHYNISASTDVIITGKEPI